MAPAVLLLGGFLIYYLTSWLVQHLLMRSVATEEIMYKRRSILAELLLTLRLVEAS
jgi:hypothetical protein